MKTDTETRKKIARAVQSLDQDLYAFLQKLVQTPSLPDQEHSIQAMIADRLFALGMEVTVVPARYADLEGHPAFNPDGFSPDQRVNMVGCWNGQPGGAPGQGSLILNGHVDVVPVGNEALWEASPWSGMIRAGKLYGRGACDMKAGVAVAVFAVEALKRLGYSPTHNLIVETVIGEESGGVGTLATIVAGFRADGAIILEPTSLKVCPVQSGALTFRISVSGKPTHAAMKKHGVSAIEKFSVLLDAILELEKERHACFQNSLYNDPECIAPVSIGTVRGGEWHSTVPGNVVTEGRFGVFPGESNEAARLALEEAIYHTAQGDPWLRDHPPVVEWFEGQFESGKTELDHPLVQTLAESHACLDGHPPKFEGVTWGSDLRLFTNHAGMPAVLYGPGDVSLAHTINESVSLDEVLRAAQVVALTIYEWCGGKLQKM